MVVLPVEVKFVSNVTKMINLHEMNNVPLLKSDCEISEGNEQVSNMLDSMEAVNVEVVEVENLNESLCESMDTGSEFKLSGESATGSSTGTDEQGVRGSERWYKGGSRGNGSGKGLGRGKRGGKGKGTGKVTGKAASKKQIKPKAPQKFKPFKNHFTSVGESLKIKNLIVLAIKQVRHLGLIAMKQSMEAVFFHEQDHRAASSEERKVFHHLCKDENMCPWYRWVHRDKKSAESYKRDPRFRDGLLTPRDKNGNLLFNLYPEALELLRQQFINCISEERLKRALKYLTQNGNESIHGVLWNNVTHKTKALTAKRLKHAIKLVFLRHNLGWYRSSLHHMFGTMTSQLAKHLRSKDIASKKNSSYKYIPYKHPGSARSRYHKSQQLADYKELEAFKKLRHDTLAGIRAYFPGQGDGPEFESDFVPESPISQETNNQENDNQENNE